jgi:hypothetical protein
VSSDPISRLELAKAELDRVFGPGHAAAHPELVAVMQSAALDFAAGLIARSLRDIAVALIEDEPAPPGFAARTSSLLRP